MSGIYIPGIEMPKSCGNRWFCHAVGIDKWHCRLTGKSFASYSVGWESENNMGENGQHPYIRRDDCPLIPVPEHGRLIDADALLNHKVETWTDHRTGRTYLQPIEFANRIMCAPTIIPTDQKEKQT